jgi:hypothetical protein
MALTVASAFLMRWWRTAGFSKFGLRQARRFADVEDIVELDEDRLLRQKNHRHLIAMVRQFGIRVL